MTINTVFLFKQYWKGTQIKRNRLYNKLLVLLICIQKLSNKFILFRYHIFKSLDCR